MEKTIVVENQKVTKQPNLIFLHVLKTGGITLGNILKRHYASEETFSTFPTEAHPEGRIGLFGALAPAERDRIRLLYGHMGFGAHAYFSGPATYVTVLRDPVERVISRFYHDRREPNNHLHAEIQAGMDLKTYVRYLAEAAQMDNLQTRIISGNWENRGHGACTPEMLEQAKDNLRSHFLLAGLTERFDEFYLMLCRAMGWSPLFYRRRNVTKKRPRQDELPAETANFIREYNQYDIELYQYARNRFVEQVRRQGDFFPYRVQWYQLRNALNPQYMRLRSFSLRHYLRNFTREAATVTIQEE